MQVLGKGLLRVVVGHENLDNANATLGQYCTWFVQQQISRPIICAIVASRGEGELEDAQR